jgi:hypothetical protein
MWPASVASIGAVNAFSENITISFSGDKSVFYVNMDFGRSANLPQLCKSK